MMAFVTVEDMFGSIECVCFPKIYDRIRSFLDADTVVSLSGKISIEEEKAPVIIVDKMTEFLLDEAPAPQAGSEQAAKPAEGGKTAQVQSSEDKRLWLNVSDLEDEDIEELLETLSYYPGQTVVCFVKDGKKMVFSQKVGVNKALFAELATFLPESCVKFV